MILIEKTETGGWESAVRGMRNPMNSWKKSDSFWSDVDGAFHVGNADRKLMRQLVKSGTDHSKFMRFIVVSMDATAPLYWWKEYDTYKVGTVANSCSTMHKITEKEFEKSDFSHEHLAVSAQNILESTITELNYWRTEYHAATNDSRKKYCWWQMIQLLPSSYNQKRTLILNFQVLRNIYHARCNHKLDEWHDFCRWIKTLPESDLITMER